MGGISFKKIDKKGFDVRTNSNDRPKIKALYTDDELSFYKTKDELISFEDFSKFIKGCLKTIRQDLRYKNYISHLKENGLDHCTFYSKIDDTMADIEMHHGPLFTLWDITSIVVNHLLEEGYPLTTFIVADIVLEQHELNNIQIVMLSKTAHQAFHDGNIFINLKQSFGKINNFLSTFYKGIRDENIHTMVKYVELSRENESTDNGLLQTFKHINSISKYNNKFY